MAPRSGSDDDTRGADEDARKDKRTQAHRDAQRGQQRQPPGAEKTPEEEEREKSQQAASEMIATLAEQITEKAPRGLLETGHFVPDPEEVQKMPQGPVQDGTYSDKQLVVRFEDGRPVEIWRADAPDRPDAEALNVGALDTR